MRLADWTCLVAVGDATRRCCGNHAVGRSVHRRVSLVPHLVRRYNEPRLARPLTPQNPRPVITTNTFAFSRLVLTGLTLLSLFTGRSASAQILFVAESSNGSITKIAPNGGTTSFVSTGFHEPLGVAFDAAGNLYVANAGSNLITKYGSSGVASAFAAAGLNSPAGLAFDAAGNLYASNSADDTIVMYTPAGTPSYFASSGLSQPSEMAFDAAGNLYVANFGSNAIVKFTRGGVETSFATTGLSGPTGLAFAPISSFFDGEAYLGSGAYYLRFANGNYFGYYSFLSDFRYLYHYDLGYEFVFDAADGKSGVYLYDFASKTFFYTSPAFPFPYLYDFSLNTVLYYYPDPSNAGHYNTDGARYFYDFATGKIITK